MTKNSDNASLINQILPILCLHVYVVKHWYVCCTIFSHTIKPEIILFTENLLLVVWLGPIAHL